MLFAVSAAFAWAQDAQLAELRARVLEAIRGLPRYTCTQTVDRSRFVDAAARVQRASCDQILANRHNGVAKPNLTRTDRVRLDVLNSDDGVEVYSWPGAGRMAIERIQDLAGEGDIGTGAFGPFLVNIFDSEGVQFIAEGPVDKDGAKLLQYRYRVPEKASHYRVEVRDRARIVPFDGRFWVDAASLELRRLTVRTGELTTTTGHCEANTSVDFARARIGSSDYLLPRESVLQTIRRDGAEARNVTRYGSCREFTGESTMRFDAIEEAATEAGPALNVAYPAGVRLTVALLSDIDTDTAAAGDAIRLRVVKCAAPSRKTEAALPPGTVIQGRLLKLAHFFDGEQGFSFVLAFEGVERGGRTVPFSAVSDSAMVLTESKTVIKKSFHAVYMWSSGRRTGTRGGTFVFTTDARSMVIPAGTESKWITVTPAK